jgi:hypothetical protein
LGGSSFAIRRANPRFAFFAEAEVTLRDGTAVPAQLCELSSHGCYIDTLEPIPIGAQVRLRIYTGESTCELLGKVIYLHSGGGSMGLFGMGVTFGEIDPKQRSAIDAWLRELASKRTSRSADPREGKRGTRA